MEDDLSLVAIEFSSIILCLLLSAFFSASETALTSLNRIRALQIIDSGGRWASNLILWDNDPNLVLTAILFGNTIGNLLASFLTALLAVKFFDNLGGTISFMVLTLTVLIFCEQAPKIWAKHNAEKLAVISITILRFFIWIFYPIIKVLLYILNKIIGGLKWNIKPNGPHVTEKDIEYMISVSETEGSIELSKKEMLEKVLDLGGKIVRNIMLPRTEMIRISIDASDEEIISTAIESRLSRIPVYRKKIDDVAGILHSKDLLRAFGDEEGKIQLSKLIRKPFFVPETKRIDELLKEFQKTHVHMAIVVDEHGGVSGLVTIEDILEEIVGEIRDEYDDDEDELITSDNDVTFNVNAKISIPEIEKVLNIKLPDSDYDTFGGFVAHLMGKIPKTGDSVQYGNLSITIVEANFKKIIKMKVEKDAGKISDENNSG